MPHCKSIGCLNPPTTQGDFCPECLERLQDIRQNHARRASDLVPSEAGQSLSQKYPQYYKNVSEFDEIDVYAVHHLFNIQDASGAIQHASKKLLLSGVRTGGKSAYKDIREARDTLTRWLDLHRSDAEQTS